MSFSRPDLLPAALALPGLILLLLWGWSRRRARAARAIGDAALVRRLGGVDLERFPLARSLLLAMAAVSLGVAASGPRWGRRITEEQSSSINVVVALDISKSMLAADIEPNRLERERLFARRLLRELSGDRVGMVVFAGRAYVLSPLTVDHGALNLYLDALDPDIVSQGGSSIAAAISQSTDLARGSAEVGGDRAVVMLTDGEALEDEQAVRAAAERAARAGVAVFTVGIGTPGGAPVPDRNAETGEMIGYKRDPSTAAVVVSKRNDALLREIATITGGEYRELDRAGAIDGLVSTLRGLERGAAEGGRRVEQPERFAYFVALALLLITLDAVWPRLVAARAARRERLAAQPARASAGVGRVPGAVRTAVLLFAISMSTGFGIGDVERGNRHYRAGRYTEAVEAYQAAIRDGNTNPQVRYNLGTALLRLGRYDEAGEQFRLALEGIDPELRQRAFHNLGNRFLEAARSGPGEIQGSLLEQAVEAYKDALRLAPGDADAKWNLEMALREQDQQPPPQSGDSEQQQEDPQQNPQQGGSGSGGSPGTQQPAPSDPSDHDEDQMSRDQAERILSAVEQDERDLTREKLRKGQRRTPVARDW